MIGQPNEIETERNKSADDLATQGRKLNKIDDEVVRATRLRVQIALLAHTKYVKVWKARQTIIDTEAIEEERINEELEMLKEMEGVFNNNGDNNDHDAEVTEEDLLPWCGNQSRGGQSVFETCPWFFLGPPESEEVSTTKKAQELSPTQIGEHFDHCTNHNRNNSNKAATTTPYLSWQTAKLKVPSYNWQEVEGVYQLKLKEDKLQDQLKTGQERYTYTTEGKAKQRIRLNSPLALWTKVGKWWGQLTWSQKKWRPH